MRRSGRLRWSCSVEVLSDVTEGCDRGEKFAHYRLPAGEGVTKSALGGSAVTIDKSGAVVSVADDSPVPFGLRWAR